MMAMKFIQSAAERCDRIYIALLLLKTESPALSPSHHFNLRLFIYGLQTIQEWADVQREQLMDIIYLASKLQTKVFFTCAVDVYLCI